MAEAQSQEYAKLIEFPTRAHVESRIRRFFTPFGIPARLLDNTRNPDDMDALEDTDLANPGVYLETTEEGARRWDLGLAEQRARGLRGNDAGPLREYVMAHGTADGWRAQ